MANIRNPFIITGEVPDKYFCDREKESDWLISSLTNGNNVVLISPRRMGKTTLVEHCYRSLEISDHYYTFFVDILPTSSLAEFVFLFSKKIYDTLLPFGKRVIKKFLASLSSLKGSLGYDAISGLPTLTLSGGIVPQPLLTLEEIFRYLEEADKPCIITIDEFQQICNYPENNIEALLRSHIQKIRNCNFVFSGSERHMMMRMFQDSSRPFYNSATLIDLRAIPEDIYAGFIKRNFEAFGKQITDEDARRIYGLMQGNTFYVQSLCNECFSRTSSGKYCDTGIIDKSLDNLLERNEPYFRERLSLIPARQKQLLYALAQEGECSGILSSEFISRHQLTSASAVQHAARQLIEKGIVSLREGQYSLSDKLLIIWIRRNLL